MFFQINDSFLSLMVATEKNSNINLSDKADEIKQLMRTCVIDDHNSNKKKEPALKRLKNLQIVTAALTNKQLQENLLDANILEEIKLWLEPLPDLSLPNFNIKKGMLDALDILPVKRSNLFDGSGIGVIVHWYSKNINENAEIRCLAQKIYKRWKYLVISRDENGEL